MIGGANIDVKARSLEPARLHTSNPGTASVTPGGVGRNIAETLARLGTPAYLVAAVGRDGVGDRLLADTRAAGVHVEHVRRSEHPTGTYTAILNADGELVIAVADMAATDELSPQHLQPARGLIGNAALLLLDGNLSVATLSRALDLGQAGGVRCILDPVSVPKSAPLASLIAVDRPLYALTPTRAELEAITSMPTATEPQLLAAISALHERGVEQVWVRLGRLGSLFSTAANGLVALDPRSVLVQDVTGAGDAMLGTFAHFILAGSAPIEAARLGHAAAALTIASTHTVRPDLTSRLVQDARLQTSTESR